MASEIGDFESRASSDTLGSALSASPAATKYMQEIGPHDWIYSLIPLNDDQADLSVFGDFYSNWRAASVAGRIPPKSSLQFRKLKDWLGWITIIRYMGPDPADAVHTLWGSSIVNQTGLEWTGKTLAETLGQTPGFVAREAEYHRQLMTGKYIGLMSGPLEHEAHKYQHVEILELPHADASGKVQDLVSAVRRLSPRDVHTKRPKSAIYL